MKTIIGISFMLTWITFVLILLILYGIQLKESIEDKEPISILVSLLMFTVSMLVGTAIMLMLLMET